LAALPGSVKGMNKTELVSAIAQRTGQSAATVGEVIAAFEGVVTAAVAGGDKVQIPGFLTFDRAERAARTGRNPSTGAEMHIPASTVPRVKPGKTFKDAVSA
jgi:DNA-binding protein HU-beta